MEVLGELDQMFCDAGCSDRVSVALMYNRSLSKVDVASCLSGASSLVSLKIKLIKLSFEPGVIYYKSYLGVSHFPLCSS